MGHAGSRARSAAGAAGAAAAESAAARLGGVALTLAAPEIAVPLAVAKGLKHAPTLLMIPFVVVSILFILVGMLIFSFSKKHKAFGGILFVLGLLLGGGAFFVAYKTESRA